MPSLWAQALAGVTEMERAIFKTNDAEEPLECLRGIISMVEKERRIEFAPDGFGGQLFYRSRLFNAKNLTKIANIVKRFIQVGDTVVQYDPVHTALPWAAVRLLLQLALDSSECSSAVEMGLKDATSIVARCSIMEFLYLPATTQAEKTFEADVLELYVSVIKFMNEVKGYLGGGRVRRILGSVSRREDLEASHKHVMSLEKKVQDQKQLVDGERVASIRMDISRNAESLKELRKALEEFEAPFVVALDKIGDLHATLKETERTNLLKWLSTVPVKQHHDSMLASRNPPQVGSWLLTDATFQTWRESDISESFWLHGPPGCGKSTLT